MSLRFKQNWHSTSLANQPIYSTPINAVVNGINAIIFQSADWYLYVVEALTGALIWKKAFGAENYGRAQAADVNADGQTEVFGASHDGQIHSLDHNGGNRWQHNNLYDRAEASGIATGGGANFLDDAGQNWVANSFLRIQGAGFGATLNIISGTGAGQSKEITAHTATRLTVASNWAVNPNNTSHYTITPRYATDKYFQHAGQLSLEAGTWYLYVTGFDGQCVKLNANTGAIIWRFSGLENIEAFPLIVDIDGDANLECLFPCIDGYVYCLNAATGAVKWSRKVDATNGVGLDAFLSYGDINSDGILEVLVSARRSGFANAFAGRVNVLKGTDGTILASTPDSGGDIDDRPVIVDRAAGTDKNFVVGSDSGLIACYDKTGAVIWSFNCGVVINASPAFVDVDNSGTKKVVVCDMNGNIYILDYLTGEKLGQFSLFGAIEGTPIFGNFDGSGINKMYVTTKTGDAYSYTVSTILKCTVPVDREGYSYKPGKAVVSTQLGGGGPRQRLDQLGIVGIATVQWKVGRADYDYLMAFYRTGCLRGSIPFSIDLIIDNNVAQEYVVQLVEDSWALVSQSGDTYIQQASLYVRENPVDALADSALLGA